MNTEQNDKLKIFQEAVEHGDVSAVIAAIPYAVTLGLTCQLQGEDYLYTLPKNEHNLGNPTLPAIHGGVIGGFMETAGAIHTMLHTEPFVIPKIVDFSLDYLSPGRFEDTYARCNFVRRGRKIVNIAVACWQSQEDKPVARARAQFLMV